MVIMDISDMESKSLYNLESAKLKSDLFPKEGDENNNDEGLNKEDDGQSIDCTVDQTFHILISEDYFVEDEEDESEYNIYSEETFEILIPEDYFIEDNNNNEDREEIQGEPSESESSESEDEDDLEDTSYSDRNEDECGHCRNNQTQESDVTLPAEEEDRLNIFWDSITQGDVEMFKTYIDAVVDINAKDVDDSNRTALHKAALAGNKDIFNILLSYGGDIFAVSGDGVTALYLAEVMGESEVVEMILQRGQRDVYRLIK